MAVEIANLVQAMFTFALYIDADLVPQVVALNQAGVKSIRLLRDPLGAPLAVVAQLNEPCAFYVLPEILPTITLPIPSAQLICTGYSAGDAPDGSIPTATIVPSDAPIDPVNGLTEADRGAVLFQWTLDGAAVEAPMTGLGFWQCTVLAFPNYEGAMNHAVPINV